VSSQPVVRPPLGWFAVLDGGVVALTVLALSPSAHAKAQAKVPLPSQRALQGLMGVTAVLHVGEALQAQRLARRHGFPARPWALQTLVVGFPSLLALRRAAGRH
jgi:hypothetical protein